MSYILDALRRADAERERGGVPGLHTQPAPTAGDDDEPGAPARGLRPWHWVVIGLAGGLAAAVAWQWPASEAPPAALPPAPPPMPAPPAAAPAAPAAIPMPLTAAPPAATPVEIAPMRATPKPAPATAAASAVAPSALAPAPAPVRVASLAELPAEARRGLPPLAFGGSIYSNTPANRLLIVNGQLMHEGDSLGPGVTLEQIRPKAAVLNIGGQRFEIGL